MRKPKISKVLVPVWAGAAVVAAPVVEKTMDAGSAIKRGGKHIKSEYRLNKVAAEEELAERRLRKATAEVKPHIDAIEQQFGVGVSPAHQHDLDAYNQDLRDEFADQK